MPNVAIIATRTRLAEYIQSVLLIREYGFGICTHLIVTLPWDNDDDIIEAAKIVSVLKTQSVKLHTLYIEKGTILERMYRSGRSQPAAD
jgi:radical SAM superfamily enzyme